MTSSVCAACRSTRRRVAQRGERYPPDAVVEAVCGRGRGLEREPGLAGAAGAGEREQADAVPQPLDHLVSSRSRPRNSVAGTGRFVR